MSGPMTPGQNIMRMPIGQTRKPMGDSRVPMSNEPVQRSEMSKRIIAARQAGVDPAKLTQRPGYTPKGADPMRPGKGDPLAVPSAPVSRPQAPQAAPAAVDQPMAGPVPMPRPRPANLGEDPRATALREAYMKSRGVQLQPDQPGTVPQRFKDAFAPGAFKPSTAQRFQDAFAPGAFAPTVDPAMANAKERLAQALIAQRSGGGQPAAPAVHGGVTPPPPSSASSPAQTPPPAQGYKPITGPTSEYVIRAPELEGKEGKKLKPAKPVEKEKTANPRYYDILGVTRGDNVAAARALQKLQAKLTSDPQSLSREEYELVASSFKNDKYNLPRTEEAIQDFFKKAYGDEPVPEDKAKPKGAKDEGRVSQTGSAGKGQSYATYVPPAGTMADRFAAMDPAQVQAYAAISQAGAPVPPRLPTQESVNDRRKYEEDTLPPKTESEDDNE